jgi:hypothetical protein
LSLVAVVAAVVEPAVVLAVVALADTKPTSVVH